ncbi:PRC-barrel domain-containing protein [Aureimonas pseudogalii]|uniref:Sporulation protein YlmC with PRC-barrel domain n=1 Tax=Aureimonas pseudogalii TaxID=1744844 RepID=A0A7W6E7W4_9HYPH|nr:PRC-barrel domain-containing protein [Aureimonas pseudogalii]MBB3996338.1 sporulation protein YlmC with PRC-barrel domain [Aureimonas pseudogalii]
MKSLVLAAGFATLLGGAAIAQTATTTTTTPSAVTANTGGAFYTMPAAGAAGSMPMSHLASDLDDKDVYGANNEKIGEIEDLVVNSDGTVAAAVVEVGGFLGVGEKDVLIGFNALQMTMDGNRMRITVPELTKDSLTSAQDVDLDTLFPDHD